jgi:hypothetical protein
MPTKVTGPSKLKKHRDRKNSTQRSGSENEIAETAHTSSLVLSRRLENMLGRKRLCALAQKDVARTFSLDVLSAFIAQRTHIDILQEMLSGPESDRSNGEMHLVDQRGADIAE